MPTVTLLKLKVETQITSWMQCDFSAALMHWYTTVPPSDGQAAKVSEQSNMSSPRYIYITQDTRLLHNGKFWAKN